RASPAIDSGETWLGFEMQNVAKFADGNFKDLVIRGVQDLFVACPSEETADKSAILRRAGREFIVYKRACQHSSSFAARPQETEAGRKTAANFYTIPQRDGHRRTVLYGGEFVGER